MKNVVLSRKAQLGQSVTLPVRALNNVHDKSELNLDYYKKLLSSQFQNKMLPVKPDNTEYTSSDAYIVSKLKDYFGTIKAQFEYYKPYLRGYKVIFIRDAQGFHFQLIPFPKDSHTQIETWVLNSICNSFARTFFVNITEEVHRAIIRLKPAIDVQYEMMKSEGIPVFALSLGIELDPFGNYEIFFRWDETSLIDSDNIYCELVSAESKQVN